MRVHVVGENILNCYNNNLVRDQPVDIFGNTCIAFKTGAAQHTVYYKKDCHS